MSILTILLILMVVWAVLNFLMYLGNKDSAGLISKRIVHVKSIGLFAIITGILGQLVGLYAAFSAIEKAADISPQIVFGGLKVSMITTLYGFLIYLASILIWVILDIIVSGKKS